MTQYHAAALVWRMERWQEPSMAAKLDEAMEEAQTGGDWRAVLGPRPVHDLEGDLGGAPLAGRDLTGVDLSGALLHYTDLSGADLTDARLVEVYADMADLSDADLSNGMWMGNVLNGTRFDGAVSDGLEQRHPATTAFHPAPARQEAVAALAREAAAARARWSDQEQAANLRAVVAAAKRGEDWSDVRYPLTDGDFFDLAGAPLAGADLRGTDLMQAQLAYADLSGADLTGARLPWVQAFGADFRGAVLDDTEITASVFSRANLTGASLRNATIDNVYFIKATLDGADLTGATITRTST